jgi:hypothetical protein
MRTFLVSNFTLNNFITIKFISYLSSHFYVFTVWFGGFDAFLIHVEIILLMWIKRIVLKLFPESLSISKITTFLINGRYSRPLMSRHITIFIMHVKVYTHDFAPIWIPKQERGRRVLARSSARILVQTNSEELLGGKRCGYHVIFSE